MKKETIDQLYKAFEQYALEVNGVECWSARELQKLLGYSKWENFTNVVMLLPTLLYCLLPESES